MSSLTADGIVRGPADVERRRAIMLRWRRHSRLILLLRRMLPLTIVVLVLGVFVWAGAGALFFRFGAAGDNDGVSIRMLNPKFLGRNSDGRPYVLTAASATRDERDFQRVSLVKPVIMIGESEADATHLSAERGVYREDTGVLDLEDDVVFRDASGYRFNTERAVIDTHAGHVEGRSAVTGVGPLGRIAASTYAIEENGARVLFKGQVKSRIERGGSR